MAIYGYTKNYNLIKPEFDSDTWHDYEYDNLDVIDAVLGTILKVNNFKGIWKNDETYNVGDCVAVQETSEIYTVTIKHTTDSSSTFAQFYEEHPEYYNSWNGIALSKDWAIKLGNKVNDGTDEDYSSKAYAISTELIADGSAKEWATKATTVSGGLESAKTYAEQSQTSAEASATSASQALASMNSAEGFKNAAEASAQESADSAADSMTYANNSEASAIASEASKQSAANTVNGFDTHAAQKQSEFDNNAAQKQAAVDASANAAAQSEQSAAASAETALEAAVKATIGNIGDIQFTIRSDVPNGSVWCDGTEYSKAEFPDVYALLVSGKLYNTTYETFNNLITNHGSCGLFALDTVNEKFKVPSLNSIALEAAQTAAGFLAESLPQHTHQYQHISGATADWTGNSNAARNALGDFTTGKADNPTYQDNAKVKTDRVVYRAYVVMYTGETEVSNGVVSEILDSCARKDLSNVPAEYDYVVESGSSIAGNQTAHYKLFKSGLLIQWGQLETISGNNTVTLPKPFADTSYQVFHGISNRDFGTTGVSAITMTALNKTTSNWLLKEASVYDHDWMAIGQGATE